MYAVTLTMAFGRNCNPTAQVRGEICIKDMINTRGKKILSIDSQRKKLIRQIISKLL